MFPGTVLNPAVNRASAAAEAVVTPLPPSSLPGPDFLPYEFAKLGFGLVDELGERSWAREGANVVFPLRVERLSACLLYTSPSPRD